MSADNRQFTLKGLSFASTAPKVDTVVISNWERLLRSSMNHQTSLLVMHIVIE